MTSNPPSRYTPSNEELRRFYIGKDIGDVPKPAVVLDVAIIKRHCQALLQTMKQLGVGFRAHIKTHKTPQIARLQVGTESTDANFVVSTVAEMETLLPLLQELQAQNRRINVLYGIPLVPSQVPRLAALAHKLRTTDHALPISVMIDHPDQLTYLSQFHEIAGLPAGVFLKVDTGYHRAGVPPDRLNKNGLLEKVLEAERIGHARLIGVYSHSSLSYAATSPEEAISVLKTEIEGCGRALRQHASLLPDRQLVISVGATPQVVSSRSLLQEESLTPDAKALRDLLRDPSAQIGGRVKVELHAGVYTLLDMQQLATNAQRAGSFEEEIAISVVAEMCSVYNEGERDKPEALVAAGTLALGREPCKSYPGWAVVGNWRRQNDRGGSRLIVERISQEHGIIAWEGGNGPAIPVRVGQAVRLYPNHAFVTGSLYGWYLVVDSSEDGEGSRVVDVWARTTGW
ncbi:D-serine dehydratase [Aspergillus udagawae]|uniref:D-serine dehydratase n=1 Tax=Aspergillus udagawae TaxID=91492 RepID=A0ABQ1BEH4_9EURO|nr:D-serine dehydratase [Aspergillus udagawae]